MNGYTNAGEFSVEPSLGNIIINHHRFTHLVIYRDHCQLISRFTSSRHINRNTAECIIRQYKEFANTNIGLYLQNKMELVKTDDNSWHPLKEEIHVGHEIIKFSQITVYGTDSVNSFLNGLKMFVKGDALIPPPSNVIISRDKTNLPSFTRVDRLESTDKYVWWQLNSFEKCIRFEVVGFHEGFGNFFNKDMFIPEVIHGVKGLLGGESGTEHILNLGEDKRKTKLFTFSPSGADLAIGITTDELRPYQRSVIFIGKQSGERFIDYLEGVLTFKDINEESQQ